MYRSARKHFAADVASVGQARDFLAVTLFAWDRSERLDDMALCLSELASNAVAHTDVAGGFTVHLRAGSRGVRLEVRDADGGRVDVRRPTSEETSGRGLLIVGALSHTWGVSRLPYGKIVWALFDSAATPASADRCRTTRYRPAPGGSLPSAAAMGQEPAA